MDPHGMQGVGEPTMSKGVGGKKIAKFVVEARLGDAEDGNECDANCHHSETHEDHEEALSPRQTGEGAL